MKRFSSTIVVLAALGVTLASGAIPAGAASRSAVDIPDGMTASYVVFDRTAGEETISRDEHKQFRSASLVKLLIALDYLESHGPGYRIPDGDLQQLQSMLRSSDDDAASALWVQDGWEQIVRRMADRIGLTDTAPPADRGMWGYTAISAADVVRIYRYVLDSADPTYRDFIMSNLHESTKCSADGFDQSFGIPSALPSPFAVKQGWSGFGAEPAAGDRCVRPRTLATRPAGIAGNLTSEGIQGPVGSTSAGGPDIDLKSAAMHTTGTVGANDEKIVVVLTLEPAGTSWHDSATRITNLTKAVYADDGRA